MFRRLQAIYLSFLVLIAVDASAVDGYVQVYSIDGAIRVPSDALASKGGETGVYVVREGRVYFRQVQAGELDQDTIRIVSGLSSGETVIAGHIERIDTPFLCER